MKEEMDITRAKELAKSMSSEELRHLQRAVESELELRGESLSFQVPAFGLPIGQGIYRIGTHIPAGAYAFHLARHISRDSGNCAHLYLFDSMEDYYATREKNKGSLGLMPLFNVYRNSPVSCVELKSGQILVIKYNGVVISRFNQLQEL